MPLAICICGQFVYNLFPKAPAKGFSHFFSPTQFSTWSTQHTSHISYRSYILHITYISYINFVCITYTIHIIHTTSIYTPYIILQHLHLRIFLELKAPQKSHHVTPLDLCKCQVTNMTAMACTCTDARCVTFLQHHLHHLHHLHHITYITYIRWDRWPIYTSFPQCHFHWFSLVYV